ncbi:MAG TPA: RNA polymerase sigma factor [Anaerolineales bacterium]|nr:RNA polymerase sigma factor [Anaerolineales bacterium]
MDEPELIRRARQGDGAAWESLVLVHQEAAFRLAYLLLGDADLAKDVAQEAFVRAFQSLHRFDVARLFRPWLLSITANLARNQRRSLGRYLAALGRLQRASPAAAPGLDTKVAQRLEAQELWQAVRRLDHAEQQVIYLRFFLELPVAETADALGVAEGTVKSRLHRALSRLRAVIDSDFPSLSEGRLG